MPALEGEGWGRVIFVSSVAAITGGIIGPHYASAKSALHGLIHWLAMTYAKKGVSCNVDECGYEWTKSCADYSQWGGASVDRADEDVVWKQRGAIEEWVFELQRKCSANGTVEIPVGRLGTPDEVAETVLWMIKTSYGELQSMSTKILKLDYQLIDSSDEQGHCRRWRNSSATLKCAHKYCAVMALSEVHRTSFGSLRNQYMLCVHQIVVSMVGVYTQQNASHEDTNTPKLCCRKIGHSAVAMTCHFRLVPDPAQETPNCPSKCSPSLPRARKRAISSDASYGSLDRNVASRSRRPGPRAC